MNKGDRVEILYKGNLVYGVVRKGGKNPCVVLDGGKNELRGPAHLFRKSIKPLPSDPPSAMDAWSVRKYKQAGGEETPRFAAEIVHQQHQGVIHVANGGTGGCNHYHGDLYDQFRKDVRSWVTQFGYANMLEPEDFWVDWFVSGKPLGITAQQGIDDFKAALDIQN